MKAGSYGSNDGKSPTGAKAEVGALNVFSFKGKPYEGLLIVPVLQKKKLRLAEGTVATSTRTQISGLENDALPASPRGAALRDFLRKEGRPSVAGERAHSVQGTTMTGANQQEGTRVWASRLCPRGRATSCSTV